MFSPSPSSQLQLSRLQLAPASSPQKPNLTPLCAVRRRRSSVGVIPTRQLSFQPVAIGAVVEVTKLPKPPMQRVALRRLREQAGRNVSERREGLETGNVGADPAKGWGRPQSQVSGERRDPTCGPTGVMATACLHREIGRNTGSPSGGSAMPTGCPRGTGRAAWGVGEVHSTGEAV
jgi:hypothetical protein